MRKTSQSRKRERNIIDAESKLRKLESLIYDPNIINWMVRGGAKGVRERLVKVDYNVVRNLTDRVPLLGAITKCRVNQVLPFSEFASEDDARDGKRGFRLVYVGDKKADPGTVLQLREFFEQTGVTYSSEREDDLSDYLQMFVREVCTIDQIATELIYNLAGQVAAFRLLDAATVKRTADDYPKKDVKFVQIVDDKLEAEFNHNNLIFDYKNRRVDIRYRGYGYSDCEMAIDLITTLLFGYNHLRDQFVKDKMPRGFISVMGDIDPQGITAIQQYWYSAMSGAGGQWAIPILPSGKDGVGLDFKSIGQSNKDMEYHRGMMFLSSVIAAVFSIDLAELGIKAEDSSSVIGANEIGPRVQSSKDRGLTSLMMFTSQHMNKILRKITTDYKFSFTGMEIEDALRNAQIMKARLETDLTINDILRKQGREEIDEEYANVVLNQLAVQLYMNSKQQGQGQEASPETEEDEFQGLWEEEPEEEPVEKSLYDKDGELVSWDEWKAAFDRRTDMLRKEIV